MLQDLSVFNVNSSPESLTRLLIGCFSEVREVYLDDEYGGMYPSHQSDELVRACVAKGAYKIELNYHAPKRADRYALSDDGILDFCFGHAEDRPKEFKGYHIAVSQQFFKRLVEVCWNWLDFNKLFTISINELVGVKQPTSQKEYFMQRRCQRVRNSYC